ncbi:MAG: CcdB family protein [Solirubrobacterales bacterium]
MTQYDVHPNPSRRAAEDMPYVVDVQSDLLSDLPTRVLVPLARPGVIKPSPHLNPTVDVHGEALTLLANQLVSLPRQVLGPPVASLENRRDDIIAALDFLFTGI